MDVNVKGCTVSFNGSGTLIQVFVDGRLTWERVIPNAISASPTPDGKKVWVKFEDDTEVYFSAESGYEEENINARWE